MGEGLLQFIFQARNERKKLLYFLFSVILTAMISAKLYVRIYGDFYLVSLSDYIQIKEFFLNGRFIIVMIIFISIYKFFYDFIDFIIIKRFAKRTDQLYYYIKYNITQQQIIDEINTSNFLKTLAGWLTNNLKQFSLIEVEKEGHIKPGINFQRLLKYFRNLDSDDDKNQEDIDLNLSYYPIPLTLQILILLDFVVIDNFVFSTWAVVSINLIGLVILLIQILVYFLNIFVDLKHDRILLFLENLNASSSDSIPE